MLIFGPILLTLKQHLFPCLVYQNDDDDCIVDLLLIIELSQDCEE